MISMLLASFFLGILLSILNYRYIDFSALEKYDPGKPSILLDDEGNEWARFQLDRRKPVMYHDIPRHLIDAFLAIEDRSFFGHGGISYKGIARSLLVNIYYFRIVQGASTITQQLVKLLFTDSRRTFSRKIKDQLLALIVERQFTKEQILETYLNHVFFGCGIYGVEAAAQRFWGASAKNITLAQAATLAGIVKNPGRYCPILFPLSSQSRRNLVLSKMHESGFITYEQMCQAHDEDMALSAYDPFVIAPHAKESIRQFLEALFGKKRLYSGGLTIQTTLNRTMQQCAELEFHKKIAQLKATISEDIDGALITIATHSGEIKSMIGGYDYATSRFNRAVQAKRQIGSVFKAIVHAAAAEKGIRFDEVEVDEPIEICMGKNRDGTEHVWKPNNYHRQFDGQMTLAYALSRSNNIVPIKTFLRVGADAVIDCAQRCHIKGLMYPYPSLALGCVDTTLEETAAAFNVFANNGIWVKPHCIRWIKDKWGNKLYKHVHEQSVALSSRVAGQVARVLSIGLERVKRLLPQKWPESQAISKTGTTNDSRTCWFVGATPEYTTAVYVGCDDNRSMGKYVFPLRTAFPIWVGLHCAINYKQKQFTFDPTLKEIIIHEKTGQELASLDEQGALAIYV